MVKGMYRYRLNVGMYAYEAFFDAGWRMEMGAFEKRKRLGYKL